MSDTVFTNVMILDGSGSAPYLGEVLVQDTRIKTIAAGAHTVARDGATVVNGDGATLMPGLVNCHGHPTYPNMGADLYETGEIPVEEHVLITMHNVKTMLDHGFTALVNGSSAKARLDIVIRNEINAGKIPGPRMQAATPELTVTGGLGDLRQLHMYHEGFAEVLDGPEDIRKYTRLMIREGVDVIKLMISGDNFVRTGTAQMTVMQEDEVAACCSLAHAHNRRVIAHARTAESVKMCIRHGITLIYHANFCDEEALDLLEANKDEYFVNPAIGLSYATLNQMEEYGVTRAMAEAWGFEHELESAIHNAQELHRRGVRVLPFGDYGFAWNRIGTDARDLEHFVNLMGFSPAETLMMATKYGGECFGDQLGMIKEGYLADLILVDGNPVEDISLLQDPDNLLMIMKDGAFHKEPQVRRAARLRTAAA